ncbi:MAG: sterol desaturase family protein [Parvularculaceae bacterium]
MKIFIGYKAWKEEEYLLNRMTLRALIRAYVTYPGIQIYALLLVASLALGVATLDSPLRFVLAFAAGVLVYPLVWYALHRFILHGSWMYKTPHLAKLWKRVHYDHHRHPNDLSVLFGGLHTTLPTIVFVTGPVGWLIGGLSGAAAAIVAALGMTCFYEFWHCGQHLAFEPKSKFWRRIKKLHLAHHFHNEQGNYGITNFFWDRVFGTHYEEIAEAPRSPTARNLGYTDEMVGKYPWVRALDETEPDRVRSMRSRAA